VISIDAELALSERASSESILLPIVAAGVCVGNRVCRALRDPGNSISRLGSGRLGVEIPGIPETPEMPEFPETREARLPD